MVYSKAAIAGLILPPHALDGREHAITLDNLEQLLEKALTTLTPYATTGMLLAALVVAVSRLPPLNIAAMVAACACLAALLSTGDGGLVVGMAVAAAGGVAGGVLLLSGGILWRRPSLRAAFRRRDAGRPARPAEPSQATSAPLPPESPHSAAPESVPAAPEQPRRQESSHSTTEAQESAALHPLPSTLHPIPHTPYPEPGQNLAFRLAAALVIALAAEALAPVISLGIGPDEMRLALWLVGMGLLAGLSTGSAIVSATGYILVLSAATLLIPDVVSDPALRPTVFGAVAALMIIASVGFSFADVLHRGSASC